MWCVPELDGTYIERMEDLLDLYERPLDFREPVVCLDEKPIQLLKNKKTFSRATRRGRVRKRDYEYVRKGTANAFCVVEPLRGKHLIKITKTRKSHEFAEVVRDIGRAYPNAHKIHLVMDNLSTHRKKSLLDHLGPRRGAKLWDRLHVHYTPKHASWLNQAETEISMFSRECLGKDRIASLATLRKRTDAWARDANRRRRKIIWKFTTTKARKKFGYEANNSP